MKSGFCSGSATNEVVDVDARVDGRAVAAEGEAQEDGLTGIGASDPPVVLPAVVHVVAAPRGLAGDGQRVRPGSPS
jgi:hypothetical protein